MSIFAALPSPAATALDLLSPVANPSKNKAASGKISSAASTSDTSSTGSGTGSSDPFGVNNLGSTFLNLLVQELQNQDPTSPMDPTAMVGQMISLNQLSQLIGINSALNPTSSSTSTGTSSGTSASPSAVGAVGSAAAIQAGLAALSPGAASSSDSATTLAGVPSATLNAAATPANSAAAAIAYGRGLINGSPSSPLDLSKFNFISGGK